LKGHNLGGVVCQKCGKIHIHPRGNLGRHFSQEIRDAWSKQRKGKPKSAIHSFRIGQSLKGVKRTEEQNKKNSERGKKYLAEHPERANALGNYNKGQKLRELYGEECWQKRLDNQKITNQNEECHLKRSAASKQRWVNHTSERKEEIKLSISLGNRKYWENLSIENWNNRIEKICSARVRVSKNQLKLYNFLQKIFSTIVLEYPVKKKIKGHYILDIALVEDKINFEYDSVRWHTSNKHIERDVIRDEYLRTLGWVIIRIGEKELNNFILN